MGESLQVISAPTGEREKSRTSRYILAKITLSWRIDQLMNKAVTIGCNAQSTERENTGQS